MTINCIKENKWLTPFPRPNGCTDKYPAGKPTDTGKHLVSTLILNK